MTREKFLAVCEERRAKSEMYKTAVSTHNEELTAVVNFVINTTEQMLVDLLFGERETAEFDDWTFGKAQMETLLTMMKGLDDDLKRLLLEIAYPYSFDVRETICGTAEENLPPEMLAVRQAIISAFS